MLLIIDTVSDSGYCFSVNGAFRQRNLEESLEISDAGAGGKDLGWTDIIRTDVWGSGHQEIADDLCDDPFSGWVGTEAK